MANSTREEYTNSSWLKASLVNLTAHRQKMMERLPPLWYLIFGQRSVFNVQVTNMKYPRTCTNVVPLTVSAVVSVDTHPSPPCRMIQQQLYCRERAVSRITTSSLALASPSSPSSCTRTHTQTVVSEVRHQFMIVSVCHPCCKCSSTLRGPSIPRCALNPCNGHFQALQTSRPCTVFILVFFLYFFFFCSFPLIKIHVFSKQIERKAKIIRFVCFSSNVQLLLMVCLTFPM